MIFINLSGRKQSVGFCRHGKIIDMQAFDRMGHPGNGDLSPVRDDGGMVVFAFRKLSHLIGKCQGLDKIFKCIGFFQMLNIVFGDDVPIRYPGFQGFHFLGGDGRGAFFAGGAFFSNNVSINEFPFILRVSKYVLIIDTEKKNISTQLAY